MSSTARNTDHAGAATAVCAKDFPGRLREAVFAAIASRRTRRLVQSLSDAQLSDTGIDRSSVLGDRPVIHAHAGLATYLASLR